MTANRRGITVADIRFGVENGSNVAVGNPFVVELRHGGRPFKRERVNGLPARGRAAFSYRRRQTGARAARLGPGDSCYQVGARSEGWNDNAGYSVFVDVGTEVRESRKDNNELTRVPATP